MASLLTNIDTIIHPGFIASTVLFLVVTQLLRIYLSRDRRRLRLPPGPKGWPIVGVLPLLGARPHKVLAKMAKEYGPVMYLKMGTSNMAVVSNTSAARTLLRNFDALFLNRPETTAGRVTKTIGVDMVFGYYGPTWKLMRKLSTLHMFGTKAREDWSWVRNREVKCMLQAMCNASSKGVPVLVPKLLLSALANNLAQMVFSKRMFEFEYDEKSAESEFEHVIVDHLHLAGLFNIGDFIPSIAWMDLQGIQRKMTKTHNKLDEMLDEIIEEHKKTAHERVANPDFLDHMLTTSKEDSPDDSLSSASVKGLLLDFFLAGTDTVASAVEWGLAEMMINPSIFKRAHEELDRVIGRDRRLRESDLPNLPYLDAICKEVLRKHPSLPLIPRRTAEECQVEGYDIPKGTWLNVNVWAIGRDPDVWENPADFIPDRFLPNGKGADLIPWANDFEMIPFGAGRRVCAGKEMGLLLVEFLLGSMIHSFDWKLPNGVDELDMEETFGLAVQKEIPLSALVSPRLSPSAYAS